MGKLIGMGELLIDFASIGEGSLAETKQFIKNAGGAPANVAVQVSKLGQKAMYLTKVGANGFGDFLIDSLKKEGVDTSLIQKDARYDTSLAFVSFQKNGEREFSFYRKKAADLHFKANDFATVNFEKNDIFEFGSVALASSDGINAHNALIQKAVDNHAIVAFDPNLRFNLWPNKKRLAKTVLAFIPKANILKLSEDELFFLTGISDYHKAVYSLFKGNVKAILLTLGDKGAKLYLANGTIYEHSGYKVKAIDTTGAGDSCFGGFLGMLLANNASLDTLYAQNFADYLAFACKCGAYTTTNLGAIPAMGTIKEINSFFDC